MNQIRMNKQMIGIVRLFSKLLRGKTRQIKQLQVKLNEQKAYYHAQIQEVRDYYENIIALMPGHVYWMDRNNVFLGCNNLQAKNAALSSRHEIVGKTNYDMLWREQAEALDKVNLKVMQTGEPYKVEEYAEMANGPATYLSQKVPLRNKKGEIVGLVGISFDITERKQLEQSLREAKERAEKANNAKTEFIRNMEHDIRTPFNGIQGLANIMLQRETSPEKKEFLQDIINACKELLGYCNAILEHSMVDAGELPIINKKFQPYQVIEKIINMEKPAAIVKGLAFKLSYSDKIPKYLIGDEKRLQQILINLVSNAIKFTNKGYVHVSVKTAKRIGKNITLLFLIKDTGIGIPADKHAQIFGKFVRLNLSNQGIYKGFGLGLHIVKKLIEETGGEISLTSRLNQGTTFYCKFPCKIV